MLAVPALVLALVAGPTISTDRGPTATATPYAADQRSVTSATVVLEPQNGLDNLNRHAWFFDDEVVVDSPPDQTQWVSVELRPRGSDPDAHPAYGAYEFSFGVVDGAELRPRRYVVPRTPGYDLDHPGAGMSAESANGGCVGAWGEFTVHSMAPDLSSWWISFVMHCYDPTREAVWGEIRVGQPAETAGDTYGPGSAGWQSTDVGERTPTAPLAIHNQGPDPVRPGTPYVTGPHARDFTAHPTCESIEPGGTCAAPVDFRPRRPGVRRAVLHVPVAPGGEVTVPLTGTGVGGFTETLVWRASPDPGRSSLLRLGPSARWVARFSKQGSGESLLLGARAKGYTFAFGAPAGERLEPGTYRGATRFPFNGEDPGLANVFGYCADSTGAFVVHEFTRDEAGQPTSFSASFTQRCPSGPQSVAEDSQYRGYVSWRAERRPPAPARPVVRLAAGSSRIERGGKGRVTARVRPATALTTIEIRVKRPGREPTLLARGRPGPRGRLTVRPRVLGRTTVVAVLVDEPWRRSDRVVLRPRRVQK